LLLSAKEDLENYDYRIKLKSTEGMLVQNLARENDFGTALLHRAPTLLDFVRAAGAALVVDGRVESLGQTPSDEQIVALTDWLSGNMRQEVFATDSLFPLIPEAESNTDVASGVLALRFAKTKNDFVLWFRPEQIQIVNWAGDPHKPVDTPQHGGNGQTIWPYGYVHATSRKRIMNCRFGSRWRLCPGSVNVMAGGAVLAKRPRPAKGNLRRLRSAAEHPGVLRLSAALERNPVSAEADAQPCRSRRTARQRLPEQPEHWRPRNPDHNCQRQAG